MKITTVEAMALRVPLKRAFVAAHVTYSHLPFVLVRLTTDEGVVGIGEGYPQRRSGSFETQATVLSIIRDVFQPLLIGQNPFDIEKIMYSLAKAAPSRPYAYCPISDALYDLVARIQGVPLYNLLGGLYRNRVAMSNSHGSGPTEEVVRNCLDSLEAGYKQVKLKIGIDPELEVKNVAAVRKAIGDGVPLAVDANCGYTYHVALKTLKKMEEHDLRFVEQPLPYWDIDGMARLAEQLSVPMAADESIDTIHSALEVIQRKAARIFVTKHHKNGGIYYVKKIWNIAEAAGVGLFPEQHCCTGVGLAAALHLCASTWHLDLPTEFEPGPWYHLVDDIVKESVEVEDGHWIVPRGPGIGVELDEGKIRKYAVDL